MYDVYTLDALLKPGSTLFLNVPHYKYCEYSILLFFQLPRDSLVAMVPHLVQHLRALSHVVHTYGAHCIERLLMVRTPQGTPA